MRAWSPKSDDDRSLTAYLRDIRKLPTIPEESKGDLARRAREGDIDAMHTLVLGHLRFVVYIAKKYLGRGLPMSDLVNEGNIGLIKAVTRFDETKDFRFTTYAVWWIRQRIQHAVMQSTQTIRIPMNKEVLMQKIKRTINDYWQKHQHEPEPGQIADILEMKVKDVRLLLGLSGRTLSLDKITTEEGDSPLGDFLADEKSLPPDEEVAEGMLREHVKEMVASLGEREARIIRLYYGLTDEDPRNLEEIGRILGLSRERVRQIKKRALDKLAVGTRGEVLRSFVS